MARALNADTPHLELHLSLLLPAAIKRVFNLQDKQLVKIFAKLLDLDADEITLANEEVPSLSPLAGCRR